MSAGILTWFAIARKAGVRRIAKLRIFASCKCLISTVRCIHTGAKHISYRHTIGTCSLTVVAGMATVGQVCEADILFEQVEVEGSDLPLTGIAKVLVNGLDGRHRNDGGVDVTTGKSPFEGGLGIGMTVFLQ